MRAERWLAGCLCVAALGGCPLGPDDDDSDFDPGAGHGGDAQHGGHGGDDGPVAEGGSEQGGAPADEADAYPDKGDFHAKYGVSEVYDEWRRALRDRQALETMAGDLNALFKLPWDVVITVAECGEPNASWNRRTSTLTICYELMVHLAQLEADVRPEVEGYGGFILSFIIWHELGHAFIHLYDLPALGGEEDAADSFATWIALLTDNAAWVVGFADWMFLMPGGTNFADEHSLNEQRAYNLMCWAYGSDPERFAPIVPDYLPEARAVRCPHEFAELDSHWPRLLSPYVIRD